MKRWMFLAVSLLILFFSSDINADAGINCTTHDQLIFSISDKTNAHATLGGGYSYDICFNNYFNGSFQGRHTGIVINLSSATNAHLGKGYKIPVIYGDLVCVIKPSSDLKACQSGYGEGIDINITGAHILFLSGETNAHASLGNETNLTIYKYQLCCASHRYNAICDYDGICEPERNETWFNCPDCGFGFDWEEGGDRRRCGNNKTEWPEECDDGNRNNDDDCDNNCRRRDRREWCEKYQPFYWVENNTPRFPSICADYNKIMKHEKYNGTETEFRKTTCIYDCVGVADGGTPPENSTNHSCVWEYDKCKTYYDLIGSGIICNFDVINESACDIETGKRKVTVNITSKNGAVSNCDPLCQGNNGNNCIIEKEVPCSGILQLHFFGIRQFIISLVILALIYFIIVLKKDE